MKALFRIASILFVVVLAVSAVGTASANNTWAVGNLVGLCAGTHIYQGPGGGYPYHTIVPEDNWTVKVIDGPRYFDGEPWWDTSRFAAGDPSGGTGWVKQDEADSCFGGGGGGGGEPPIPPPTYKVGRCESTAVADTYDVPQSNGSTKKEHFIVLTIPHGEVLIDKVYTDLPGLESYTQELGVESVSQWTIQTPAQEVTNMPKLGEREWRVLVPGRVVDYWFPIPPFWSYARYKNTFWNSTDEMVYLMCKEQVVPTSSDEFLPILTDVAIVSPISGTQLNYQVEIPSWMSWVQTSLRMGSNATITLVAPDGTVYSPTSSAVTYTDTSGFAVHTLNLASSKGGTWQVLVDVISADSDSVFMLDVYGKQYNDPSTDNIPPVTGMHFDGTKGLNSWFVSDVVVTLSAEDNLGGSGVQGIEWSTDNGTTWDAYVSPFIVSQEGLSLVLGRAYDHAGNFEKSPIGKFLLIDKTSPVVNVWVDQPEYTRVQPFTAHFSGYDPEPGSGLFSLTALFNNQPVIDGQVVDLFWLPLGTYTLTATGEDNAGWVTNNSKSITLIATIPSLQQTVNRLCTESYITKQGTCTSLSQKLASALSAQQRGQNKTAVNVLLAFQNELNAQKGKAVTLKAYNLLMMDSNYVIQVLGGK